MEDITVIDNFLSTEDLEYYLNYIKTWDGGRDQAVFPNPELVKRFWSSYHTQLESLGIKYLTPLISISRKSKPIDWHKDDRMEKETHKLLIYLNDVTRGGTQFRLPSKEIFSIENRLNRLVIFNMKLVHKGEDFDEGQEKFTIGFRAAV